MPGTYFSDHAVDIRIESNAATGLRTGQLGAIWAVGSHFTVSKDPVQVVLPTGVGKTAVMTLIPFVAPTTRVLVITPGRLIRDQVIEEFITLSRLKAAGVFPEDIRGPVVRRAEHRVTDWSEFEDADVVVGTPQVVSSSYSGVAPIPEGTFDLVLVDEAHHAAAPTWHAVLTQMEDVRRVLLTATPFRRDRQGLPGDIIYRYPLRLAIDEGVYQPISFHPVELGPDQDHDEALIEAAFDRLADPVHEAAGSALLVRTDRVADAKHLQAMYESAGIPLALVTAQTSMREIRKRIGEIERRVLRGVVSVGVLGEGFDLPRLKIAVYHQRHKSLPATLQFVGRIARVMPGGERPPAELIAIRSDVQDETRELYADDSSWDQLVPQLVDAAIDQEQARRNYTRSIRVEVGGELSVHAIEPMFQAEVFVLPDETLPLGYGGDVLVGAAVEEVFVDDAGELLAIVTRRSLHPDWLRASVQGWDADIWELHLVVLDRDHGLAFISTSSDTALAALTTELGWPVARRVEPEAMNRFLHRLEVLSYSSVGMKSIRAPSPYHASYQTVAGSTVNLAVSPSDARAFGVGHLIGRHRDDQGFVHAIGISVGRRKVWATEHGDLLRYKQWCQGVGLLMEAAGVIGTTAPLLPLAMPTRLTEFPDDPIALVLSYTLLQGDTFLVVPGHGQVDLASVEFIPHRLDATSCALDGQYAGETIWSGTVGVDGTVEPANADLEVRRPDEVLGLSTVLAEAGITIYFADGSSTEGGSIFRPTGEMPPVPQECLRQIDWSGVDVHRESKPGRDGKRNVQQETIEWLLGHTTSTVVIVDDSANELADVIAFDPEEEDPLIFLAHCKWSSEDNAGHRLDDVHDVVCQAIRSARWANARAFYPELLRRLTRGGVSGVVSGPQDRALERIAELAASGRPARLRIGVFQPGLRIAGVDGHAAINTLLVNAVEWVRAQGADLLITGG